MIAALPRGVHPWLGGWLRDRAHKALLPRVRGQRHLLFCVCDHFEPRHGRASRDVGLARVRAWRDRLPNLAEQFRDSNGRSPRHTFFFPGEEYDASFLEPLAELVGSGFGEVEVHLHHDRDTRASLRQKIERTLSALDVHGVIARRDGRPAWSFIHGNWALANGRPDGRWCGVDDELRLLFELGCYADFTFPSAPDPCQPRVVNRIYYPHDDARRRGYDEVEPVRVGPTAPDRVLLLQGPLALARRPGRWPRVRIESGALSAGDPPTRARLATWIDQWVHVEGRPQWCFVKVHSHGAPEGNAGVMLGQPMASLHRAIAELRARGCWQTHYVTAREMYNVARAAMRGMGGSPADHFDSEIGPPERAARRSPSTPCVDRLPAARR
jgi:hypothetical protein